MALLASLTLLSQLQEVCIHYHVALVIHILHAFLCEHVCIPAVLLPCIM